MTDYRPPTKQPCSDCPFRRKAMPGWLGAGSPESFIDCMNRDEPLPCHQTINYDDPRWLEKWTAQESGSMCAGALIFMANKMQLPRTRGFPTMPRDKVEVFASTYEFVRHHREAGIHSWDDDQQSEGAVLQRELIRRAAEATGQPIVDFASVPARHALDSDGLDRRSAERDQRHRAAFDVASLRRRDERIPLQNIPVHSELGKKIRRSLKKR